MPAFTAAATYLVTSFAGAAFAATAVGIFVTSVVAVGLAVATSKLINGSGRQGGGTAQDPGVRVQLPPATNNKVPVVYGSAFQKGTVTDARISNSNKNRLTWIGQTNTHFTRRNVFNSKSITIGNTWSAARYCNTSHN
jgi:hypothetical protein